jgi:predicted acyl esterase
VHFVTAPFAHDIKGAVLQVQDCERYNILYRNGFYKIALHGEWYVDVYKNKGGLKKNYNKNSFNLLPLSDFSKTVFGETVEDFDEILKHPDRNDEFWKTRFGGYEAHNAIKHANIPILLVTGFYDIYTGGIFDMWNLLDEETKSKSALAVHPFDHGNVGEGQPINFENGNIEKEFVDFSVKWAESIRGKTAPPFEKGKVTYYNLFENKWRCDDFESTENYQKIILGDNEIAYEYDPENPATFKGGLSANFGGNAWQEKQNRNDVISVYTPEFPIDTWIKGKMKAKLKVKSSCEDTCFYVRISLCKKEGDYGLRDDINQISNFKADYISGDEIEMDFSFDEHSFVISKGEKLRIDISSSAFPLYVRHTNVKGLFSEQTKTQKAINTVVLNESFVEIPLSWRCKSQSK